MTMLTYFCWVRDFLSCEISCFRRCCLYGAVGILLLRVRCISPGSMWESTGPRVCFLPVMKLFLSSRFVDWREICSSMSSTLVDMLFLLAAHATCIQSRLPINCTYQKHPPRLGGVSTFDKYTTVSHGRHGDTPFLVVCRMRASLHGTALGWVPPATPNSVLSTSPFLVLVSLLRVSLHSKRLRVLV